MKYEGESDT